MAEDNSTSGSPPAQAAASSSTTPQANAQTSTPAPGASQADMVALVQALARMQNGTQIDPALSQNPAVQQLIQLVKSGKITHQQLLQFAKYGSKAPTAGATTTASTSSTSTPTPTVTAGAQAPATPSTTSATVQPSSAYKSAEAASASSGPTLMNANPGDLYPAISQTLNTTNPGAVQWPATRPTLSGGLASGRVSGTPSQIARSSEDVTMMSLDDNRTRKRNTPGDQSMRRTIQDLVSSIDPNVKIEPEVEDLLLNIADEFIDSVTNFSCRLAKHRGGDTLEVRDLQLHLERNHNIRIPGFASDDARMSLSQSTLAPSAPATSNKKGTQGPHMTLRAQRLAQVQQAKREAKLM